MDMLTEKDLNSLIPGSKYFRLTDALWLPKWEMHAVPPESVWFGICRMAATLDKIRELLRVGLVITSWYRPKHYNALIRGAKRSAHMEGIAVDFIPLGISADEAREKLKPVLEAWAIRVEDKENSSWCHVDGRDPGPSGRFFIP